MNSPPLNNGDNKVLCGNVTCGGLCLFQIEKFGNGSIISNYSKCYSSQFAPSCYNSKFGMACIIMGISMIPNILSWFYFYYHRKSIIKKNPELFYPVLLSVVQSMAFSYFVTSFICYLTLDEIYEIFIAFAICLAFCLFLTAISTKSDRSNIDQPSDLMTFLTFHPKIVTFEEFQYYVTNARTSPPIFSAYQVPNPTYTMLDSDKYRNKVCDIQYTSWQEEGPSIALPTNTSIFAYFTIKHQIDCGIDIEFHERYPTTSSKDYIIKTKVLSYTEPMVLIQRNDVIFRILNQKWIKYAYFLFMFCGYHAILDLVYLVHAEFVQINCIKNAANDNSLRAEANEKDNQAIPNIYYQNT